MTIKFNVPGKERKRLATTLAAWLGEETSYMGAPSFVYTVGNAVRIDRDGVVTGLDLADETLERLLEHLYEEGFEYEVESAPALQADGLTISLPLGDLDPESLERLKKLTVSKQHLIQKALGTAQLTIESDAEKVSFPWFDRVPSPEEISAYSAFIAALCKMAKEATRVTAKEKEVESEKYAFRSFLLRLGFSGAEHKEHRRILLKNLSGSAAFPNKTAADAFSAAQKAKRDAAKEESR